MIAPKAKINDGLFDIVNIGDLSTAKILLNAHTLYRGTHTDLKKEVKENTLAKKIEVSAYDPSVEILLETDGELRVNCPQLMRSCRMRCGCVFQTNKSYCCLFLIVSVTILLNKSRSRDIFLASTRGNQSFASGRTGAYLV